MGWVLIIVHKHAHPSHKCTQEVLLINWYAQSGEGKTSLWKPSKGTFAATLWNSVEWREQMKTGSYGDIFFNCDRSEADRIIFTTIVEDLVREPAQPDRP